MKMTERKRMLIYKLLLFIFAFAVAFMPSTVSRNREVNNRVIVEMLGLDGSGTSTQVTAQYVMPAEADNATTRDVVTVSADSVPQAVEAISTALGRRAELGHCSMIIVGADANPSAVSTLITSTDITSDAYLSAADGSASELMGDIAAFMKKTGATDADFIAYSAQKAHIATTTALNFLSDLGSASHTAYMPLVETIKEQSSGSSGGGESSGGNSSGGSESGGGGGGENSGEKKEPVGMKIEKLALYGENGRLGVIEKEAARGVAWVSAPIEEGVLAADIEYDGVTYKNVSARLVKKHAKLNVEKDSARVTVYAEIAPSGDGFNRIDSENALSATDAVRTGFSNAVKKELVLGYFDSMDMKADPYFIAREYYRHMPDLYEAGLDLSDIEVSFDAVIVLK